MPARFLLNLSILLTAISHGRAQEPDFRYFQGGGMGNAYILKHGEIGTDLYGRSQISQLTEEYFNGYRSRERFHRFTYQYFSASASFGLFDYVELGAFGSYLNGSLNIDDVSKYPVMEAAGFFPFARLNLSSGKYDAPVVTFYYQRGIEWSILEGFEGAPTQWFSLWHLQMSKSVFSDHLVSVRLGFRDGMYSHNYQWTYFPISNLGLTAALLGTTMGGPSQTDFDYRLGAEYRILRKLFVAVNASYQREKTEYPEGHDIIQNLVLDLKLSYYPKLK